MTSHDKNREEKQSIDQKAHSALEAILQTNEAIAKCDNPVEARKLAAREAYLFRNLENYFAEFRLAYECFHLKVDESDFIAARDAESDEAWRHRIAMTVRFGIPFSSNDRDKLADALEALNEGEVTDILTPAVTGKRKSNWTLLHYQFLAVAHHHALRGLGLKAYEARERVAEAYGSIGPDTVKSWQYGDLKKRFQNERLKLWATVAHALGAMGLQFGDPLEASSSIDSIPDAGTFPSLTLEIIGMTLVEYDLETCGHLYQAALRGKTVETPVLDII